MSADWDRLEAGVRRIDVPASVREAALLHLDRWWTQPAFAAYRPQLEAWVTQGNFAELVDAFRQVLPFGTGGRRGRVGVGPNRLNPWTVGSSVEGHARWMRSRQDGEVAVVIAYDVRRFDDVGGVTDRAPANPVTGLSSRGLAELAARVYAANGVIAWLLPRGHAGFVSTPELSASIRLLGAQGGLNVSASHNPPDDNGVKVYDERGAQLVPPDDEELLSVVAAVEEPAEQGWDGAVAAGRIRFLSPDAHDHYVRTAAAVVDVGGPRVLRVLYTPLHGTGVVHEVLRAAGFSCEVHAPQATADGAFSTVPGGVANPENPAAMAHALAAADGFDLVFGTDPDADRIGVEVRHEGAWVHLTGNDIAALVVHRAAQRDLGGRQPLVVQTEVTSTLVSRVAAAAGAAVVDDLLVGFKYVAEGLRLLEEQGTWRGLAADQVQFVAGAEESHGVLVTDAIRDKDAAGGAVLLAALAAEVRPSTLVDVLDGLRHTHGYVVNGQRSVRFEGATGASRLSALLERLRASPPVQIDGRTVNAAFDHRDESGRFGPMRSGSDRASRNVLVYHLASAADDDGARVILRPSGTEPKLKLYSEVLGRAGVDAVGRAAVDAALTALEDAAAALLTA